MFNTRHHQILQQLVHRSTTKTSTFRIFCTVFRKEYQKHLILYSLTAPSRRKFVAHLNLMSCTAFFYNTQTMLSLVGTVSSNYMLCLSLQTTCASFRFRCCLCHPCMLSQGTHITDINHKLSNFSFHSVFSSIDH